MKWVSKMGTVALVLALICVSISVAAESKLERIGRKVTMPDCWQEACPHCECTTVIAKRKKTHPLYVEFQRKCARVNYWWASKFGKANSCKKSCNCR